ncbi:hypothetical protein C479_04988 [Halovivax asiaticus JCM 14624]|uniref:Uncharacterized protein n=1 Tax=Halovivax asiaticus JCM 14624 TaxID=1227490 RepID=M0BMQ1_9EURY|nr:hypothetical protein [Halovivax asiaticus]ELZ12135.1 hypothetical protein C479_04988 [Halovivax asiaticus JCM 14624]
MSDLTADLQSAYEAAGYDVSDVTTNRDLVRIVLAEDAGAEAVRSIVTETLDEEPRFGVDVATEAVDGQDGVSTVVSFRDR